MKCLLLIVYNIMLCNVQQENGSLMLLTLSHEGSNCIYSPPPFLTHSFQWATIKYKTRAWSELILILSTECNYTRFQLRYLVEGLINHWYLIIKIILLLLLWMLFCYHCVVMILLWMLLLLPLCCHNIVVDAAIVPIVLS